MFSYWDLSKWIYYHMNKDLNDIHKDGLNGHGILTKNNLTKATSHHILFKCIQVYASVDKSCSLQ